MKRKILAVLASVLFASPAISANVLAAEMEPGYMEISRENGAFVYNAGRTSSIFLQGVEMMPGDSISRELEIENKYHEDYELFLKMLDGEAGLDSELARYLNIKLYWDNEIIYDGPASESGNFGEMRKLTDFASGAKGVLRAEAVLSRAYGRNSNGNETVNLRWTFYARQDDGSTEEIIPNPNTRNNVPVPQAALLIGSLAALLFILLRGQKATE